MADKKNTLQFIWGVLLVLAGIGLFFRIPQLMPEIKKIEQFAPFIYFIFLLLFGRCFVNRRGRKKSLYICKTHKRGKFTCGGGCEIISFRHPV